MTGKRVGPDRQDEGIASILGPVFGADYLRRRAAALRQSSAPPEFAAGYEAAARDLESVRRRRLKGAPR